MPNMNLHGQVVGILATSIFQATNIYAKINNGTIIPHIAKK